MFRNILIVACVVNLVVLPSLVLADEPTTAPSAYATPADVFAAAVKAYRARDEATFIDCQSPDSQQKMVEFMMYFTFTFPTTAPSTGDPALAKEKADFAAKYGLDNPQRRDGENQEQFAKRLAAQIKDKRAFLLDFASHQDAHDKRDRNAKPVPQLVNVQIEADGTTAVGKEVMQINGGTSSTNAQFKKIDGSWKINSVSFFY